MFLERPGYLLGLCPAAEAASADPSDWLSAGEIATLSGFASEKRRLDWLAGRIAAKRVGMLRLEGETVRPRDIEVVPEPNGRPRLRLVREAPGPSLPGISISHGAWGGLAAISAGGGPIGADIEAVQELPEAVLTLYLGEPEREAARNAAPAEAVRLWAVKEAVLKLLGTGLSLSPLEIMVRGGSVTLGAGARAAWERLGAPALRTDAFPHDDSWIAVAYA